MHDVALALGSNMGDSAGILQGALDDLAAVPGLDLVAVSAVFETDPVGGPEQEPYLNAVVLGLWTSGAHELLEATSGVEQAWHRERSVRWGPRTLDIDILAVGDLTIDTPDLVVPHPRAHERGFVLVPWLDVAADATIPGRGRVADLVTEVDVAGVRRTSTVLRVPADGAVR
jgi:2-amino-4-hydroxy-6-hydroxymethyldihydropteridine diphosphokinase